MPTSLNSPDPRQSLAFSRKRDAWICWLVQRHPLTAEMLVYLNWFSQKRKAVKRLRRLVECGRTFLLGTVCQRPDSPEQVFCGWRAKPDQLLHEVQLTQLFLRLDAGEIQRGPSISDQTVLPDAELRINGQLFYLELDRGTMGTAQIAQRFLKYESCPHLSLWVCSSEARTEVLRQRAVRLRSTALFTTYAEALADPHAEIWRDFNGGTVELPREPA